MTFFSQENAVPVGTLKASRASAVKIPSSYDSYAEPGGRCMAGVRVAQRTELGVRILPEQQVPPGQACPKRPGVVFYFFFVGVWDLQHRETITSGGFLPRAAGQHKPCSAAGPWRCRSWGFAWSSLLLRLQETHSVYRRGGIIHQLQLQIPPTAAFKEFCFQRPLLSLKSALRRSFLILGRGRNAL